MDNLGTQEENIQIFKRLAAAVEGKQVTPIRGSYIAFFCSEDDRREPDLEAHPPFVRFGVRDVRSPSGEAIRSIHDGIPVSTFIFGHDSTLMIMPARRHVHLPCKHPDIDVQTQAKDGPTWRTS
jgi:hypothetical protein